MERLAIDLNRDAVLLAGWAVLPEHSINFGLSRLHVLPGLQGIGPMDQSPLLRQRGSTTLRSPYASKVLVAHRVVMDAMSLPPARWTVPDDRPMHILARLDLFEEASGKRIRRELGKET